MPKQKELIFDEIQIEQKIGRGSFGDVYRGRWKNFTVAIKILPIEFQHNQNFIQTFQSETQIMSGLRHPNCVVMLGASAEPPNVCIIMEYMSRGSLQSVLHDTTIVLPWSIKRQMMLDAAAGMSYLHLSTPVIVHRDLKTQNLLVDQNWQIKVADFGLSKILGDLRDPPSTMTSVGTPSYAAPEILSKQKYGPPADVYSFAIILWEMSTRATPYPGLTAFQVILQVSNDNMRPIIPLNVPSPWAHLIRRCWISFPDQRPSFVEVHQCLELMQLPSDGDRVHLILA